MVAAHALPPIMMKGISREIIPYVVEGPLDDSGGKSRIFSAHMSGVDFYLDSNAVDAKAAADIRTMLRDAMTALEEREIRKS